MALEVGTFISDLVATNPTSTDPKAEGDDHIRLLKSTVKTTFPNVTGAVTPTHTELNFVDGVTSSIQGQLDTKAPLASPTFTGTVTIPSGASIAGFAPLASPALTGTPTAPTAAPGTNTTQLATTEFVVSQAFATSLPGQTGNNNRYLRTDGTSASWQDAVSSVAMSVPAFLSVAGTPITSTGTLAITYSGTALPVANGGTGVTTSTGSGANVLNTAPSISGPTLTGDTSVTGRVSGSVTTDNDLSFSMSAGNNFSCTTSGSGTLTFTNITAGQSGFILLVNASNHTISAAATTKITAADLTKISASGSYLISYFSNGTDVFCVASGSLA
jgi:hypothetical protein